MAQRRGKNQTHNGARSFGLGDVVKHLAPVGRLFVPFGLANPVFIDAMSINPWISQVSPTKTEDRGYSQGIPKDFKTGTSRPASCTKKHMTPSSPGKQKRYNYTRLPSDDEYPPSYDDCVPPAYTSLTEK